MNMGRTIGVKIREDRGGHQKLKRWQLYLKKKSKMELRKNVWSRKPRDYERNRLSTSVG